MKQYKYLGILACLFIFNLQDGRAQYQQAPQDESLSSITLAVVMPQSIEGLTDGSVARLGTKMAAILTNNGIASADEDQTFIIYPKFEIVDVKETAGGLKKITAANCNLSLFIQQSSTKTIFASFTKAIIGSGFSRNEAIANAVTQISVNDAGISKFIARGKEKIVLYYQQNCAQFIKKADLEFAKKQYDASRNILLTIPEETGDCYEEAQLKLEDIFAKQFGSVEKAAEHYQKEVTINPYSSIFSKIFGRTKKIIKKKAEEDKTPPVIELITPAGTRGQSVEADVVKKSEIYVSGTAKDISGISKVTVNGKAVDRVNPDGFFQANIPKDAPDIVIEATDNQGNSASATFHIAVKNEAPVEEVVDILPISDDEKFHAIFIANSDYSGGKWQALKSTIPEARKLRQTLIDSYNFDAANIDTVFNKNRKDILTAVSNKLQKLTTKDNLVLFYGGHGYFVESANMAYWVPLSAETEFEYISNTDINNLLSGCNARHILVMADACFSGAMRGGESVPAKYEYKTKSRQLLTSGGTEPVPGVSIYVKSLLEQLAMNEDKYISARDLQTRIYPAIKNVAKTECTLSPLQVSGSEGGQFYFKKKLP